MPVISVIIPVYNTEKYLSECLDSVLNQTFEDIEIIIVNDGTTDRSLDIATDYAQRDTRIRIISQPNQGLSMARNNGMKEAQGEYLLFLDSDDFISCDYIVKLYNAAKATGCDVAYSNGAVYYYSSSDPRNSLSQLPLSTGVYDVNSDLIKDLLVQACLKLYKRTLIESLQLEFPKGLRYEDQCFHYCLLPHVPKIALVTVSEGGYFYRQRENSIMGITTQQKCDNYDHLTIFDLINKYYVQHGLSHDFSLPALLLKQQLLFSSEPKICFHKIRKYLKKNQVKTHGLNKEDKRILRTFRYPYFVYVLKQLERKVRHKIKKKDVFLQAA